MTLCLASHSPRRRSLLEALGVPFVVRSAPSETEEAIVGEGRGEEAELVASARAESKGEAVLHLFKKESEENVSILAADTVVHLGRTLLDKPADPSQAAEFLRTLSGQRHGVVTALWFYHQGRAHSRWVRTWVDFDDLSEELIADYIGTSEPYDKAGGYGIQGPGSVLVRGVEGCFYNVMGLPVNETFRLLQETGFRWRLGGEWIGSS